MSDHASWAPESFQDNGHFLFLADRTGYKSIEQEFNQVLTFRMADGNNIFILTKEKHIKNQLKITSKGWPLMF